MQTFTLMLQIQNLEHVQKAVDSTHTINYI